SCHHQPCACANPASHETTYYQVVKIPWRHHPTAPQPPGGSPHQSVHELTPHATIRRPLSQRPPEQSRTFHHPHTRSVQNTCEPTTQSCSPDHGLAHEPQDYGPTRS